jgi:NAD(P)-dependent dehydrogenase (short-subunit alcohol dehydrogenase family)
LTNSIDEASESLLDEIKDWDILISCPCIPQPLVPFFESKIEEWEKSFYLNSLAQLRFLYRVYHARNKSTKVRCPLVLFFAGGGTNGPVQSFSAYTSAKIHLIKMFELMAYEEKSTKFSIIGPGWTYTKAHYETLRHCSPDSAKFKECVEFLSDPSNGTPLIDIFNCIEWIDSQEIDAVSGRNFSVVNDEWKGCIGKDRLINELLSDPDMYKLRRCGNGWRSNNAIED